MRTSRSNTILVSELLSHDGPYEHVADNFVRSICSGCGTTLTHDPRYGEWGAFCSQCWADPRTA